MVRKRVIKKRKLTATPGWWRVLRVVLVALLFIVLFAAGTIAGVIGSYSKNLPDINRMADYQPQRSTHVYARDGTQLANLYRQNRVWVPVEKIPTMVRDAFIATEDQHFYKHHGVDFGGIVRAALADYRHQAVQGASTITQQLARALFLSNERSISRKIQEALLAMEIERYYTKDEILERYLNLIYFGSQAYGVEAASHTYFGKGVGHLSVGQAALLAGLPAAPSDYSPYVNVAHAKERQRHVLDRMAAAGYISQAEADHQYRLPLGLVGERQAGLQGYKFPYFTTYVVHQLEKQFGAQATYEGGLQVYTTLDPKLQQKAQDAVDWGVSHAISEGIGAHQAALVSIRPSTGEIVAMVGGAGGFSLKNQFNRAWQAHRQPGSSFKVYVYTAAVDSGMPPSTIVEDTPADYPMGDGTRWSPEDDDHRFLGAITLRYALAQSRNVVAVKLAQQLGVDRVIAYAKRMGVRSPLDANLSLALGTSVVTPLDQASGFATLANQGIHIEPSPFRVVKDSLGAVVLDDLYPQQTEVLSAGTAFIMDTMLQSVIQEGTGYPNADIGRPAGGKTGTTTNFRDAWFVGFTPDLVTAVWLGNDDYTRMNESYGGNIPARTWARYMRAALEGVPKHEFPFPAGEVVKLARCGTGKLGGEYYLNGTEPISSCGGPAASNVDVNAFQVPAAATLPSPGAAATSAPAAPVQTVKPGRAQPPNTVGDGTTFENLDNSTAPPKSKHTQPK
ncbi:MAG: PBP1A family penicillin-binding protein [Candidatus Eremiobacteraeota bacterium]|nr:PBP1A family penicillin-binding protein [Candidatus Eremiobacteraeota bacterium]